MLNLKSKWIKVGILVLLLVAMLSYNETRDYFRARRVFFNQYVGVGGRMTRFPADVYDLLWGHLYNERVGELPPLEEVSYILDGIVIEISDINVGISDETDTVKIHTLVHVPKLRQAFVGVSLPSIGRRGGDPFALNYAVFLTTSSGERQHDNVRNFFRGNSELVRREFVVYKIQDIDIDTIFDSEIWVELYMNGRRFLISDFADIAS